jgi:hypothetical protein
MKRDGHGHLGCPLSCRPTASLDSAPRVHDHHDPPHRVKNGWPTHAQHPRVVDAVRDIAAAEREPEWRNSVIALVYGVIEQEFDLSARQGWRFAEWLLKQEADATAQPHEAERLRDGAAFVRWMRLYVAKNAPPNPPRRAPRSTRIAPSQRRGEPRVARPATRRRGAGCPGSRRRVATARAGPSDDPDELDDTGPEPGDAGRFDVPEEGLRP